MAYRSDFPDEVRARLAISEVIGRKIKLTRKGREHLGLCPFHSDRKPSLTVSDEKGFYHCFSCQAHGDVFSFVMETEGLSFPEALEQLAGTRRSRGSGADPGRGRARQNAVPRSSK